MSAKIILFPLPLRIVPATIAAIEAAQTAPPSPVEGPYWRDARRLESVAIIVPTAWDQARRDLVAQLSADVGIEKALQIIGL